MINQSTCRLFSIELLIYNDELTHFSKQKMNITFWRVILIFE